MEKISVSIRVRPLDKQEAAKGSLWKINNNAITLCSASGAPLPNHVYIFDNVFNSDSTTFDIYRATTQDIVASAVKGFNGTVFAYGQTSSGKTFTMRGTQEMPGIIPLAIHDVFKNLEEAVGREFLLRMSYMEIYNEDINDLLAPEQTKLQVHESVERGIFVAGLREEIVASPEQVLQLMEFGEAHRHIGETNMNVHSSRSHTIFRMVIESRDKSQDDSVGFSCDAVRVSVLNLVDLAGSERVAKTGAEGARLKEGTHINKSLMVLGTVINKLSEGIQNQGGHVPYRDSKLTRILQPALGGNARTAVICNITPAMVHVDESRGTLQFASRAIRVTNCAQVNEILTDAALLKRQKKEIEELRSKLKESHSEHFEEEILTLRNTLLKSECERERIALELQEEKRAHAERERKQAQKIENLSTLVLNSTVDDRDFEKRSKKNARRETWCPRITTGNTLDEDVDKPWKEDRWTAQSRDRLFPMPPPFESLLEEDESSNDKEHVELQRDSPRHQERYGANNDKDSDGEYSALPDPSARIHVADRKRKYYSDMPSVSEDGFQEQLPFFKKSEHGDLLQTTDDFEIFSVDSEMDRNNSMDIASSIPQGNGSFQSEKIDNFNSKHLKNEGDLEIGILDGTVPMNLTDPMIQQLSQELIQAKDEIVRYRHQLDSALKELEQLKNQGQVNVKDSNEDLENLLKDLKKEKEELAAQLTEAYLQFEEEKAAWEAAERPLMGQEARKIITTNVHEEAERVKFLEMKLLEAQEDICAVNLLTEEERRERLNASNEAMALREKVTELERELGTLKASEVAKELSSLEEDCDGTINFKNLVDADLSLELLEGKPKEIPEIIDVIYLKNQGKDEQGLASSEATKPSLSLTTAYCGPNGACDDHESLNKDIEHLRERISELESLIADMKSEKEETVLELKLSKSKMEELEKEAAAANTLADHERNERAKRIVELSTMQDKINELETKLLQERALRETESGEVQNLKSKVLSIEDLLGQSEAEFIKERWILKTEILKLQVSLDAITAKAEVFHGRLLESRDELKDVYEELDRFKDLNEKQNKDASLVVETSKIEMQNASVSNAEHDKSVKQSCSEFDAMTVGCKDPDSVEQLTSCIKAQNRIECNEKQRIQSLEKVHMDRLAVGSQFKLMDETRASVGGNLAQTVSLPLRSAALRRQEHNRVIAEPQGQSRPRQSTLNVIAEPQGQSRPRLSTLNVNSATGNRITSEVESMPAVGKSSVMLNSGPCNQTSLKPPKALLAQKNPARPRGWLANANNKENR